MIRLILSLSVHYQAWLQRSAVQRDEKLRNVCYGCNETFKHSNIRVFAVFETAFRVSLPAYLCNIFVLHYLSSLHYMA